MNSANQLYVKAAAQAGAEAGVIGSEKALRHALNTLASQSVSVSTYTRKDGTLVHTPVDGFGGYNCGHQIHIYRPEIGRTFTDPLEGTRYTTEEVRALTTKQRALENNIRKTKREIECLKAVGLDTTAEQARLRNYQQQLNTLLKENSAVLTSGGSYRTAVNKAQKALLSGVIRETLEDIQIGRSLGAAAHQDTIIFSDGTKGKIAEDSRITRIKVIAGYGTSIRLKAAKHLAKKYGGDEKKWQKMRGNAHVVDCNGLLLYGEVHWYQEESTGRVDMKFKQPIFRS